jgi:putative ABC transport system substrate-binding protein
MAVPDFHYREVRLNTRRRILLALALGVGALAAPLASFAQEPQGRIPRIGFLIAETLSENSPQASRVEALRAGLRDRGYVEGKNIAIEFRSAEGNYDRLPGLAAELARLKVDVPELVINMKTTKALGVKIPESILLRADKVIK